jgi:hypothetical protein
MFWYYLGCFSNLQNETAVVLNIRFGEEVVYSLADTIMELSITVRNIIKGEQTDWPTELLVEWLTA